MDYLTGSDHSLCEDFVCNYRHSTKVKTMKFFYSQFHIMAQNKQASEIFNNLPQLVFDYIPQIKKVKFSNLTFLFDLSNF